MDSFPGIGVVGYRPIGGLSYFLTQTTTTSSRSGQSPNFLSSIVLVVQMAMIVNNVWHLPFKQISDILTVFG
jgi:hypothetical protein